MNKAEILRMWAPHGSPWSRWVKPVLFAHMEDGGPDQPAPALPDVSQLPPASGRAALLLDLPGAAGVWTGAALARAGYQPVPLYNAMPEPDGPGWVDGGGAWLWPRALVDVRPIVGALRDAAAGLPRLPPDAPPAFLLDADRHRGRGPACPTRFDNRSICFATDFPSRQTLADHDVGSCVLVRAAPGSLPPDLRPLLARWRREGLPVYTLSLFDPRSPRAWVERRWPVLGAIADWFGVSHVGGPAQGLGFGRTIPIPSGG